MCILVMKYPTPGVDCTMCTLNALEADFSLGWQVTHRLGELEYADSASYIDDGKVQVKSLNRWYSMHDLCVEFTDHCN